MLGRALLLLCLCSSPAIRAAAKPELQHLFPAGAVRGSTNDLTFFGSFDPWPPKAWCSAQGVEFQFSTNKGKATVVVSREAVAGPSLLRVYNDEGASDLRIFIINDNPEILETEPNDHFARVPLLANLPGTINGRLEKNGDVDSFMFRMTTGQWLDARLDSYTLLATLDPVLRLVTTNGYQITWNHDSSSLDPRLVWQSPYDLTVVLQVFGFIYPANSDIRLSGGSAAVYRLHATLSEQPPADLLGSTTEREPNDSAETAAAIQISSTTVGTIYPANDADRFKIDLKKDDQIEVRVLAATLGSPFDAWCAVVDSSGKELVRNDDANNSRDPRIEWKAPEDGTYFITVGSLTHQGSSDFRYHLALAKLEPDYSITSSADAFTLSPGATNGLKLKFKRLRGFTNELTATVEGLPKEISTEAPPLPAADGDFSLSLIAPTNAPAFNGPFQVIITDKQSGQKRPVSFDLVSRSENNGVPGGYAKLLVESTDQLWLTIKKPAERVLTSKSE